MKKVCAIFLSTMMIFAGLSGCSKKMDIEELVKNSEKAAADITSCTITMNIDYAGTYSYTSDDSEDEEDTSESLGIVVKATFDEMMNPVKMHGTLDMSINDGSEDEDNASSSMELYMIQDGDSLSAYMNADGAGWYGEDASTTYTETTDLIKETQNLLNEDYIEKLNLECTGSKNVNDIDCYVVTGNIDGDTIIDLMKEAGEDTSELEDSEASQFLGGLDIPFTYYVDQETFQTVRIEIDFASAITSLTDLLQLDVNLTSKEFTIDYSNYNKIDDITVPDDVKEEAEKNETYLEDDYY